VPGYETLSRGETFKRVTESESQLRVLEKLRGFSVAAEKIITEKGQGSFHLVVLNSADKSVSIRPYGMTRLEQANAAYAEVEKQAQSGERIEETKHPPSIGVGKRRRDLVSRRAPRGT
jgi:hypothetical protein